MKQHEVKGHYGAKFVIFQCPDCSGIWVDSDVIFAMSRDSAVEAEDDVSFDEIQRQPRDEPRMCPRCATNIEEETGGSIPQGLRIDCCPTCHGFWFDKGELMIYKSYLEEKRQKFKKREAETEQRRKRMRETRAREIHPQLASGNWQAGVLGNLVARALMGLLR